MKKRLTAQEIRDIMFEAQIIHDDFGQYIKSQCDETGHIPRDWKPSKEWNIKHNASNKASNKVFNIFKKIRKDTAFFEEVLEPLLCHDNIKIKYDAAGYALDSGLDEQALKALNEIADSDHKLKDEAKGLLEYVQSIRD